MIPVSQPSIGPAETALVLETLSDNQITSGPMVRRFEDQFAALHGRRYGVACTSGTTALHLALAAAEVGPGDEVIIPDLTYVATANAVRYVGATPVLVDIDPETWCLDPVAAAHAVTPRTRAIVPVHLYGCAAAMTEINWLACRRGLIVIEDAAEGLGGFYGQKRLGACGHLGCFSFYGNKIMTTGEGGMVLTNNTPAWERMKSLRGMAQDPVRRYYHTEVGFNYRMTDLQAAVGVAQLTRFAELVKKRNAIYGLYAHLLRGLEFPAATAPWMFTCLLPRGVDRERVMFQLLAEGIETRPTFTPLHHMTWLSDGRLPPFRTFPVAEDVGRRGISLPTWPEMVLADVHTVAAALQGAL
jgi:perosamine synthetase